MSKNLLPCEFCSAGNLRCARVNGRECKCGHCLSEKAKNQREYQQIIEDVKTNPDKEKSFLISNMLSEKVLNDEDLKTFLKSSPQVDKMIKDGWEIDLNFIQFERNLPLDKVKDYQHFTPQFHLNSFKDLTDKNQRFNVLNLKYPEQRSQLKSSKNFAGYNGYLSYEEGGQIVNDIDPLFGPVETDFSKFINQETLPTNLSPEEIELVSKKMALMHLRSPRGVDYLEKAWQNNFQSLTNDQRILIYLLQPTVFSSFFEVNETVNYSDKKINLSLKLKKKEVVTQFKLMWDIMTEDFKQKDIHLIEFSSNDLISGDQACSTFNPNDSKVNGFGGIGLKDTEVFYPISPNKCLVSFSNGGAQQLPFSFKAKHVKGLDEKITIDCINFSILRGSRHFIISNKPIENLKELEKKIGLIED